MGDVGGVGDVGDVGQSFGHVGCAEIQTSSALPVLSKREDARI